MADIKLFCTSVNNGNAIEKTGMDTKRPHQNTFLNNPVSFIGTRRFVAEFML